MTTLLEVNMVSLIGVCWSGFYGHHNTRTDRCGCE